MTEQLLTNKIDRDQILYQFNDTISEYPKEKVFQELFEEQVEKTPDSTAIIFNEQKLTYRELNNRSNQLARLLREKGVKPDQIVGLMVDDNSPEMVIGMIGILKAGGAFLPIDSDFPKERIDYLLQDSRASVLLFKGELKETFQFSGEILNLGDKASYTRDSSNLEKINRINDLAYVIYTSGSTGKPKGVQIEHTSIVNQIFGLEKLYPFDSSLHHILLAPVTFDPSVQQIFLPLTSGGKLFLVAKSVKQNLKELWDFIVLNKIDIVNTVPSLMSALLDNVNGHSELDFKYIILAGEVFSKNLYLRLKENLSTAKIINIYGPTEATINTTLYECKETEPNNTIPIGKPLMNYNVYLLDEQQDMVPIGEAGEICISGVGLARGYLNNPQMTAEKFLANPFKPGERIYRTGDLGKWSEDGNIEFLGRVDYQVKINGIRLELGEVETVMNQHPSVQETIVVCQKDNENIARLIAYVLVDKKQTIQADELRSFLREKLPGYMVPSSFVVMEEFPLTFHGKVDRNALPDPEKISTETEGSYIPPRNESESHIKKIWEKVLGIERIGVRDNFFDIGGTSLLAMILFSEIEKVFGKNLPLATIIDSPTVEGLAKIIDNKEWSASWSPLVPIQPNGSNPPFFCVHGHRGNVIGFHDLARSMGTDQPFYGIQAEGLDGKPLGQRSITEMAANYVKEIRTVQPNGPYFLGGWCMGGTLAYEMAQILRASGEKVALVALIETNVSTNYPKRLPGTKLLRRVYYKIFDRIKYEISIHRTLNTKDRLSYVWRKIRNRTAKIQVKSEKVIGLCFTKVNLRVPHSWQYKLDALVDMHENAIISYKPQPYNGRIAIFRANNQPLGIYPDPTLGWSELLKGKVDLCEFPGHHLNTFIEPSVRDLASKLKHLIEEAKQE